MSSPAIAVVVQARMSSARMPGKVLAPLAGEPALWRMMQRVRQARAAGSFIVATSSDSSDDAVEELCRQRGLECARGPLDDVLTRIVGVLPPGAEIVVRLTADCPLIDPGIIDLHIETFSAAGGAVDYVSNAVHRTMPDGLDVEVVSRTILEQAHEAATSAFDREHCTPWVRRNGRLHHVTQEIDLSELRWTLDTPADHQVLSAIYEELSTIGPSFDSGDVYRLLLRRPDLIHVRGQEVITDDERDAWCRRIRRHLATRERVDR